MRRLALQHSRSILDHKYALWLTEEYGQRIAGLRRTELASIELLQQCASCPGNNSWGIS